MNESALKNEHEHAHEHGNNQQRVYNDVQDFLEGREDGWKDYCGFELAWGSLIAIFEFIFVISPDKSEAVRIITEALSEFTEQGES